MDVPKKCVVCGGTRSGPSHPSEACRCPPRGVTGTGGPREMDSPRRGFGLALQYAIINFIIPGLGHGMAGHKGAGLGWFVAAVVLWPFALGWIIHIVCAISIFKQHR